MKKIPVKFVVLEPELRPSQRIPAGPERLMFSNAAKLMIKDNHLEIRVWVWRLKKYPAFNIVHLDYT